MINTQSIKSGRARAVIMLDCMQIKVKIIQIKHLLLKQAQLLCIMMGVVHDDTYVHNIRKSIHM